jgi:phosphoheptose isomerase
MKEYIDALTSVDMGMMGTISEIIASAIHRGKTIYTAGNGGSFCIAEHFAADLIKGFGPLPSTPRRVVCLGGNRALATAISNDIGYERGLIGHAVTDGLSEGDVVVAFSVSGMSPNIVELINASEEWSAVPVVIVGKEHRFTRLPPVQCNITVSTPGVWNQSRYGICEGVFSCVAHEIANRVHAILEGNDG